MDESDEDMADNEGTQVNVEEEEEEEDEIVESDIELEGEIVEPDHDPPQKVDRIYGYFFFLSNFWVLAFYMVNTSVLADGRPIY